MGQKEVAKSGFSTVYPDEKPTLQSIQTLPSSPHIFVSQTEIQEKVHGPKWQHPIIQDFSREFNCNFLEIIVIIVCLFFKLQNAEKTVFVIFFQTNASVANCVYTIYLFFFIICLDVTS